jgi:prolyl 4-hydroxylase
MHTACPVIKGIKWSAAKWIHVSAFRTGEHMPSLCGLQSTLHSRVQFL